MLSHATCLALLLLAPVSGEEEFTRLDSRRIEFPLTYESDLVGKMRRIDLFVSWDKGKTWKKVASVSPPQETVRYNAPRDGEAWFAVQVIYKDGTVDPAQPGASNYNIQKALIDTGKGDPTKDEVKSGSEKPPKVK